ncbi:transglutaminaseTgpA domain-containing protein [Leifsonia sp. F6_8S_P_1B]|uniref:TransglutaminaseTgpA domain-containing protein n=1 Tax=Leifsonia williamsii TaxID=3035919 RepID=A0ABT8KCJ4_9MICO|nr:transglutaminaseTgpA domain-containing protein [Leifsonia williamsii]MDN4615184.1 transglutaminaseTgpA domain-containing protein [Leifsonia williamsii]
MSRFARLRAAAVDIGFALLAVGLAGWSFWPVYQSPEFIIMLAGALVLGAAVAVAAALFRWPSIVVAGLFVLVFLAAGVQLAVPSLAAAGGLLPTADGFVTLVQATWLSWKQLVTITVPVGSYQALLVPAFLLTLLATVVAVSTAVRSKRPELAAIVPVVLLVTGVLFGSAVAPVPIALVLVLGAVLVVWLIRFRLRRRSAAIRALREQSGIRVETARERRSTVLLTAAGATVMMLGAGAVGIAAAALAPPPGDRQVVRTAVEQPFDPRDHPSPLSGFRRYLQEPVSDRPMLSVTGLTGDRRLRIATLDTYDGVTYSVGSGDVTSASGSFTRLPYRLDQSEVRGTKTELTVTIRGYRGPWVPGSGQLEQLSFLGSGGAALDDAFYYNDVTGTGAVTTDLSDGDIYTADSVVKPQLTASQLERVQPGSAAVPRPSVVPDELQSTLQKYTAGITAPGARLAAALKGLAADGYISHGVGPDEPASRSGHGADRITELLTDVPMLGDQEQYAVTAALMARQLGFPARVVVGFVAPGDVAVNGPVTFVGSDISAWIEVQTTTGWVTVDPTPPERPVPPKQPEQPTQISRPQTNVQPPIDENPQRKDEPPQSQVDSADQKPPNPALETLLGILTAVGWTLLVLCVLVSPFLAVIAAKWRRRSLRRSARTASERIVGGWREFADAAVDHGYDPPPSATRVEFAQTIGGARASALAKVADRAVFSPIAPTPEEADTVWKAVDDLRAQLAKRDTRWKRLLAAVSLRSLGYRGGTRERKVRR